MKNIIEYVCHEIFNQIKKTLQENWDNEGKNLFKEIKANIFHDRLKT